jgi:hypothetical protein
MISYEGECLKTRALNAAEEPRYMQPHKKTRRPCRSSAAIGTLPNDGEGFGEDNGVITSHRPDQS